MTFTPEAAFLLFFTLGLSLGGIFAFALFKIFNNH